MDKFVVTVFPDEAGAYAGVKKLKALHQSGSLTLVRWAVVQKDARGGIAVKEVGDPEVGNTVFGALLGGLVGLLGGPVGAAMGMSMGAMFGALGDLRELDVGEDFLEQVSDQLTKGRSSVVAEVFEAWVAPLDAEMEEVGGVVLRQIRFDFEDEKAAREAEADRRELERLRAEWAQAAAERKAKLQASIERTEAKLDASLTRIEKRLDRLDEDAERKIKALQDQLAEARDETRREIERQIADTRADLEARRAKLKQAAGLAREALAPAKAAHAEPA
jgi:uncharacterized membrane protein